MADRARDVAFDVLRAVEDEDAYANLELARLLRGRNLSGRDAAFATELASGTLRMRGAYDHVIDTLVNRDLDPPVRDALRLGAHQLLSMRVPAHAAVGTTVSLVRSRIGHRPAGLVNAVLRKIAAKSYDDWLAGAPIAARHSHPQWIVDLLTESLDGDVAPLLEADNLAPKVTLVARPGLATVSELGTADTLSPIGATLQSGDPGSLPAVREGRAGVQDAGSQLVALATAAAPVEGPDHRWLDMCAGPGGKAALWAALADQQGGRLLAAERQPHRAELVRQAVRATRSVDVVVADGRQGPWLDGTFDRVLLDAPCSGLGALRRRPESRWRRRPEDIDELVPLQRELLAAALRALRPGGVVGYATCSPVLAETVDVVREALADPEVALVPLAAPWPADGISPHLPGAGQLWPHRHRTDAMFLAVLRRVG